VKLAVSILCVGGFELVGVKWPLLLLAIAGEAVVGPGVPGNFDVCEFFRLRRLAPDIRPGTAPAEGER